MWDDETFPDHIEKSVFIPIWVICTGLFVNGIRPRLMIIVIVVAFAIQDYRRTKRYG